MPPQPTASALMGELQKLGKPSHRNTFIRHGAPPDAVFGVPIGELKKIQRRIKKDHQLALDLFATGNSDAMYLAGLIADEGRMTRTDLNRWAREATWGMISMAVAGVAADSPHALPLGLKWIRSPREKIAATGWATLSGYVGVTADDEIDVPAIAALLRQVAGDIHGERNEVKDCMNQFVIAVGCFVAPLKREALAAARAIGKVDVDVGDTHCKIPDAEQYIEKVAAMGRTGRKRKSARC